MNFQKKRVGWGIAAVLSVGVAAGIAGIVAAQEITFPIAELGGCENKDACRAYCDEPAHQSACVEFAKNHKLVSGQDASRAKKFIAASSAGGPGGCRGPAECRAYCAEPGHRDECIAFAKKHGLLTRDQETEFETGQRLRQQVGETGGPGGCRSESECRSYCSEPSHVEECVAFASAHAGVALETARAMVQRFTEQRIRAESEAGLAHEAAPEGAEQEIVNSQQKFEEFRALEQQFRTKEFSEFSAMGRMMPPPPGQGDQDDSGMMQPGMGGQMPQGGIMRRGSQGQMMPPPGGESTGGGASISGGGVRIRVGPGGCASPEECIKYCIEHKEECFARMAGGGTGQGSGQGGERAEQGTDGAGASGSGMRGSEGGGTVMQNSRMPQLRSGILRQFRQDELPQNFMQMPEEQRAQFFRRASGFDEENSGMMPPGSSRGGRQRMPYMDGQQNGEKFMGPSQGGQGQMSPGSTMMPPPPGGMMPQGNMTAPPGGGYGGQEGMMMHPPDGQMPGGMMPPPPSGDTSGGYMSPPPSGSMPSGGGSLSPPPAESPPPPPPSSAAPFIRLFGALAGFLFR